MASYYYNQNLTGAKSVCILGSFILREYLRIPISTRIVFIFFQLKITTYQVCCNVKNLEFLKWAVRNTTFPQTKTGFFVFG